MKTITLTIFSVFLFFSCFGQQNNVPFEEMGISLEEYNDMKTHHVQPLANQGKGLNTLSVTKDTCLTVAPIKDNPNIYPFHRPPFRYDIIGVPYEVPAIKEEGYDEKNN